MNCKNLDVVIDYSWDKIGTEVEVFEGCKSVDYTKLPPSINDITRNQDKSEKQSTDKYK